MDEKTEVDQDRDESSSSQELDDGSPQDVDLKDVGLKDLEKVIAIKEEIANEENPAFGSNKLLLEISVQPQKSVHTTSVVSFSNSVSRLWADQPHSCAAEAGVRGELGWVEIESEASFEKQLCDVLQPWEKWGSDLEYGEPPEVTIVSQTKGLAYPTINLYDDIFPLRLFVLLPSSNDTAPVRGYLIVSSVAKHSCYVAVRHSRGNPAFLGTAIVDGKQVEITKNLEVFLTHIRHPTRCRVLYIRELCINRYDDDEREHLLLGRFHAMIENCSCGIVEMSQVMCLLDEAGYISEPPRTSKKSWDVPPSDETDEPFHMPMILRDRLTGVVDAIEEGLDHEGVRSLPTFEYVPLDVVAREIRVLAVYPAKDKTDPIIVDIFYVPLHSGFRYHALSYVWGSSQATRYLRNSVNKIAVTENLHSALIHFRSGIPDGGLKRFIWADAVCIDQNNPAEKAQSVPRMHMIYDEAAVVVVNLLSDKATLKAGMLLKIIAEGNYDDLRDNHTLQDVAGLDDWADLYGLLQSRYFTRRWVVQELASASAPVIMISEGSTYDRALRSYSLAATLMSSKFYELLKAWNEQEHPALQQYPELLTASKKNNRGDAYVAMDQIRRVFRRVKTLDFIRSLCKVNWSPSFLLLVTSTQNAECADARDRIYSLWNIAHERSTSSIDISYDLSVEGCYMGFTKAFISMKGSLDIICTSQFPAKGKTSEMDVMNDPPLEIPSWCPDYRQRDKVSSLIRRNYLHFAIHINDSMPELDKASYHADKLDSADASPRYFRFDDQQLIVQGVILDTIEFASSDPYQDTPVDGFFESVASSWMYDIHTRMLRLRSVDDEDDTSWRPPEAPPSMTSNEKFHWMNTLRSEKERDVLFDSMMSMVAGEAPSSSFEQWTVAGDYESPYWQCSGRDKSTFRDYLPYHERAGHVIRGRRLIITEKGFMGLAPWHARSGLKLAILCGCSVPVLLKETDGPDTHMPSESSNCTNEIPTTPTLPNSTGWYFRGDCFVQGWMGGELLRRYGSTTQDAWEKIKELGHEIRIN